MYFLSGCDLPTEIVFLRTTVPAYGSYHLGSYDVKFDILEGNVDNAFDIMKRVENGMYVGEYWNFILLCVFSSAVKPTLLYLFGIYSLSDCHLQFSVSKKREISHG